jgi:aspartate racemase
MKKMGIVGGVGWRSTVDYYTEICRRSAPRTPEIAIESLDHNKAVSYLGMDGDEESWSRFDQYHRAAIQRLEAGGADFALIASNTPHHRFASIVHGIGIPVINIFDAVAKESARAGAREVLILGTAQTMTSPVIRAAFARHGVAAAGPSDETARALTAGLIAELQLGKVKGAAERLARIARTPLERRRKAQPVVCLACTELPLAFGRRKMLATFEYDGVLYVDSTAVHINAAFEFACAPADGRGPSRNELSL